MCTLHSLVSDEMSTPELLNDGESYEDAELCCQICGVSFNIGRIRTANEPGSSAWCGSDDETWGYSPILGSYVCDLLDDEDAGCASCLVAERGDLGSDESDSDFVNGSDEISECSSSRESHGSVNVEEDQEASDLTMASSQNNEDQRVFQESAEDEESYRQFIQVVKNVTLTTQHRLHQRSTLKPTLQTDYEHIASTSCVSKRGYNGNNISFEEMRACTTVQFLIPRTSMLNDSDPYGPMDDDTATFFVHGLTDRTTRINARHPASVFPPRFGCRRMSWARNVILRPSTANLTGMPFHPYCLEVFKRASLHRLGRVDLDGLTNWFRLDANPVEFFCEFPRDEAVGRGRGGSQWQHVAGDEWIVANPCINPTLDTFLESVCTEASEQMGVKKGSGSGRLLLGIDPFVRLPLEVRLDILMYLGPDDITTLRASTRAFSYLPQHFLHKLVIRDFPWLWEAWCPLPYSFWATTTERECKVRQMNFDERRLDTERKISVLEQEGPDGEYSSAIEALRNQAREEHKQFGSQPVRILDRHNTDWSRVYDRFTLSTEIPKGLRNRSRIWKDCEHILDRIGMHRASGRLTERSVDAEEACEEFLTRYPHLRLSVIRPW